MVKIRHLFCVVFLAAFTGLAQPGPLLFVPEHNWTWHVGSSCYGVSQWRVIGDPWFGARSYTDVYFGRRLFSTRMRAEWMALLPIIGLAALGGIILLGRDAKTRNSDGIQNA